MFLRHARNYKCIQTTSVRRWLSKGEGYDAAPITMSDVWTRDRMLALIQDYEGQRCFWAIKSNEYRDRQKKELALASIVNKMKKTMKL